MKRISLLTMMCLLASTINLQAHTFTRAIENSTYRPLAKDGKVWNFQRSLHNTYPKTYQNYSYIIKGDTTINDKEYKKLYYRSSRFETYAGALRDENGRAYYVQLDSIQEKLYYDMTVQGGDRINNPDLYAAGSFKAIQITGNNIVEVNGISVHKVNWRLRDLINGEEFDLPDCYEGIGLMADKFLPLKFQVYKHELLSCIEDGVYIYGNKNSVSPNHYRRPIRFDYEAKDGLNHPKSKIWAEYDDTSTGFYFENVTDSFKIYVNNNHFDPIGSAFIGSTFYEWGGTFGQFPISITIESEYEKFSGQISERYEETDYRPFIEEGKVWKVGWFPGAMDIARKWDYYYFEGDSIIDGRQCKIMRCRHEAAEGWGNPVPWTEYVGSIYEEGRRVYCVFPQKETFELLYDFASAVADTICIHDPCVNDYIGFGIIEERGTESEEYYKGNYTAVAIYQEYWDPQNEENHLSKHYDHEHLCYWMEGVGSGNPLDNVCHWEWAGNYYMGVYCTVGDEVLYKNTNPYIVDGVTPQDSEVKKNWLDFTHTVKTKPKAPSMNGKWTARPNGTLDPSRMNNGALGPARRSAMLGPSRTGRLTPQECSATSKEETVTGEYSVKELFVNFKTLAGPYTITVTDAAGDIIYNKVVQTSNVVALNTDISSYPKGSYTITVENEEEMYTAEFNIKDEDSLTPNPSPVGEGNYVGEGEAGAVYDLSGRRIVNSKSETLPLGGVGGGLSKGIYIINGRKVVVK